MTSQERIAQIKAEIDGDSLGLSIDMLDVDRLREWARLLLVHGADIGHWGSVPHVVSRMQTLATGIEKAIRDIGTLRAEKAEREQELQKLREENERLRTQIKGGV